MTPVFVLLLQRADDSAHADRAWGRMTSWEPAGKPSVLSDQIDEALRLTRDGADPAELCKYDEAATLEKQLAQRR